MRVALVGRRGNDRAKIPTSRDGRRQPYRERRRWFSSSSSSPSSPSLFSFFLAFSKVFGRGGLAARIIAMSRSSPRKQAEKQPLAVGRKARCRVLGGVVVVGQIDQVRAVAIYEAEVVGSILIVYEGDALAIRGKNEGSLARSLALMRRSLSSAKL